MRARNNDPALKVVIIYNMMNTRHAAAFEKIAGEDPYTWALKLPQDRNGQKNHPTAESHKAYAQTLAEFIKTIR